MPRLSARTSESASYPSFWSRTFAETFRAMAGARSANRLSVALRFGSLFSLEELLPFGEADRVRRTTRALSARPATNTTCTSSSSLSSSCLLFDHCLVLDSHRLVRISRLVSFALFCSRIGSGMDALHAIVHFLLALFHAMHADARKAR